MTRLIQIKKKGIRRVALVEEPNIRLLDNCSSIYELAHIAIAARMKLSEAARQRARLETIDYDAIYNGSSEWRLLPAIDHPEEPARCLISGTGLTHLGSARGRQSMHATATEDLTDSMKMFRWGVEGGRPAEGTIGIAPEWFHKGSRCVPTVNRSTFLPMLKTAEKRLRSRGFMSLPATDGRIASAWRWATSFRIINLKRRTI
jgi:hypothetical protein